MPDEQGRILNYSDAPLTARGIRQARALGDLLAEVPIDAIFSSDLYRAKITAEAIADGREIQRFVEPALREIDVGAFDGISLEELRHIDTRFLPWPEIAFAGRFPQESFCVPADLSFPDGESVRDTLRRALPAFERIARAWQGATVMIVSHAWLSQALLCHLTGTDVASYFRFAGANAVLTLAEVDGDGRGVLHVLNGNADPSVVTGGRVQPAGGAGQDGEVTDDFDAARRLGAGEEGRSRDLATTARLLLVAPSGPAAASERLHRLAGRIDEIEIDAVICSGDSDSLEFARAIGSGRPVHIEVEPALGAAADPRAFLGIIARELGHTATVVAESAVLQRFIAHVVMAGPDSWDRFGIEPATMTLVEVGVDGRGILAMLNGAARLDELAGGQLLRASGGAAP